MHVAAVIKRKGSGVVSITPDRTIADATNLLTENRIGAVLVMDGAEGIRGIISERDIIRALSKYGADALTHTVGSLMTREVQQCSPNDTIAEVMTTMTTRRFRHLPVVDGGKLLGMISIGDVVKQRLDDTELEVETLRGYVTGQG
jgi:CBS domain-containing protein